MPFARAQGQAQARRSIELSETNSAEILTNLNLLNNRKEGVRSLDDQLRSLRAPSSQNSMEDRFSIPYMAPTVLPNSKRLKELLDRQKGQKNWALTSDELNLFTGNGDSDPLATFGDDKNGSRKSLQQFYDTLTRPADSSINPRSPNRRSPNQDPNQDTFDTGNTLDDDSSLPPSLRDKTQKLRNIVNQDPANVFNPAKPPSSFDNFFGLVNNQPTSTPEENSPAKTSTDSFLEQYKKGLDPATVLGLNPALSALLPNGNSLRTAISPDLTKLPTAVHPEVTPPTPATVVSVPDPTTLSDMNATVLNQWNPLYSKPKLELPRVTTSPSIPLNYEYPHRRF